MALKTFVKVSNISNLSDARYCAGMMVDMLGFNIDPRSDKQLSPSDFKEITGWISGAAIVGEFQNAEKENICQALNEYAIDYIQISDINKVESINLLGKPLIFHLSIDNKEDLQGMKGKLSYLDELVKMVVIKSGDAALFEAIDAKIGYYNANLQLLKGYGLLDNDHLSKFPGIEIEAAEEDKPGFKDYGDLMSVLELLEEE